MDQEFTKTSQPSHAALSNPWAEALERRVAALEEFRGAALKTVTNGPRLAPDGPGVLGLGYQELRDQCVEQRSSLERLHTRLLRMEEERNLAVKVRDGALDAQASAEQELRALRGMRNAADEKHQKFEQAMKELEALRVQFTRFVYYNFGGLFLGSDRNLFGKLRHLPADIMARAQQVHDETLRTGRLPSFCRVE